jgi:molybdate transport system substrate-binding protein
LICSFAFSEFSVSAPVSVFVPASLKEAMDEQAKAFEVMTGNQVVVSYGNSRALAKQIEAGAHADVFISADVDWMDYLDQRHLLAPRTRTVLLRNTLVLIAPASSSRVLKIGLGFPLAAALGGKRLAMANPESVPSGKYGKSALEALGIWGAVERQVVPAESVRVVLALVSRGEAAYGIVYRTDALTDRGVRIVDTFPADSHRTVLYSAAVLASSQSPAARALLDSFRVPPASAVWEKHGFGLAR